MIALSDFLLLVDRRCCSRTAYTCSPICSVNATIIVPQPLNAVYVVVNVSSSVLKTYSTLSYFNFVTAFLIFDSERFMLQTHFSVLSETTEELTVS